MKVTPFGLTNEEVALCDLIVTAPVDPAFPSLNLAHAVLVAAYEWRVAATVTEGDALPFQVELPPPAAKAELVGLFEHQLLRLMNYHSISME